MSKRKALIVASFRDAGTGESFTADDTPMIDAGAFANYEAAGLVRAPDPERAPRKRAKPSAGRRRTSAARSPAAPAAPAPAAAPASEDPAPSA